MVHMIHHQDPPQEILDQSLIFIPCFHQIGSYADGSRLLKGLWLWKSSPAGNGGQGKEGGPSVPVLFQMTYQDLGCLLGVSDHILDASSQGRFNGRLVFLRNVQKVCHDSVDPPDTVAAFHDPPDAVSITVVPLRQVP